MLQEAAGSNRCAQAEQTAAVTSHTAVAASTTAATALRTDVTEAMDVIKDNEGDT